jgi:mRNA-degrading endonuclease HigB of HigAB toxin-antitoxin module
MKILVKKTLLYYTEKYPAASMQLMIWFGSHKEYDSVQAATINFDTNILDFKTKK